MQIIDHINVNKFRSEKKKELSQFTYQEIDNFDLKVYLAKLDWNNEKDHKEIYGMMTLFSEIEYNLLNTPVQYGKDNLPPTKMHDSDEQKLEKIKVHLWHALKYL